MPWSADHSTGHDSSCNSHSISIPKPASRPTARSLRPSATVPGQSKRQGRCGTARMPSQRSRMLASGGPSTRRVRSSVLWALVDCSGGHRPGGVDAVLLDPDPLEEALTAVRIAEGLADLRLIAGLPGRAEGRSRCRSANRHPHRKRLTRQHRGRCRGIGRCGHADLAKPRHRQSKLSHAHRQRIERAGIDDAVRTRPDTGGHRAPLDLGPGSANSLNSRGPDLTSGVADPGVTGKLW